MPLNKAYVDNLNIVLQAIGLKPLTTKKTVEALEQVLMNQCKGIAGMTVDLIEEKGLAGVSAPASAEAPVDDEPYDPPPDEPPARAKPARTPASRGSQRQSSNRNSGGGGGGGNGYFDYWKGRITALIDAARDAELGNDIYAHLDEQDARYHRNSTEKQMKRIFAICLRFLEDHNIEAPAPPGRNAGVGSQRDDSQDDVDTPF